MKKLINKVLKYKRTISFAFAGRTITETWTLFGTFKFSTHKTI